MYRWLLYLFLWAYWWKSNGFPLSSTCLYMNLQTSRPGIWSKSSFDKSAWKSLVLPDEYDPCIGATCLSTALSCFETISSRIQYLIETTWEILITRIACTRTTYTEYTQTTLKMVTLQGSNISISHLGKREIIFKHTVPFVVGTC